MYLGLHVGRYRSVQGFSLLCCKPSECHFAASSTEISLFWLCSFWAASVCDHVEMLFFRATTRWQNTPWHHLQAGLLARQAGAVQDYEEAAAATAAEFLSLHLSCCSVCVLGDASATISGRPRPVRFLLSLKSKAETVTAHRRNETLDNVPADDKDLAQ